MIRHGESEWNKENKFCGWYVQNEKPILYVTKAHDVLMCWMPAHEINLGRCYY